MSLLGDVDWSVVTSESVLSPFHYRWERHGASWTTYSCDAFKDESEALVCLVEMLQLSGAFAVFTEVIGQPLFRHSHHDSKSSVRADVVAIPKRGAAGAIVIEVKGPGKRLGPVVNQLSDYMQSVFFVGSSKTGVIPTVGFAFPFDKPAGDMKSVMDARRLGTISPPFRGSLSMKYGCSTLFQVTHDGNDWDIRENLSVLKVGKKRGSR